MRKVISILLLSLLVTGVSYAEATVADNTPKTSSNESAKPSQSQLIDLNSADQATLEKVKGIGARRAAAIIDYRQTHGSFKSVDELLQVKGISPAFFEKIRDQLTVSAAPPH